MTPTEEQALILRQDDQSENSKIVGMAGTAKSTMLSLLAQQRSGRGRYIVFGKKAQMDAQARFPAGLTVSTAHAVPYQAMGMARCQEKLSRKVYGDKVHELVGLPAGRLPGTAMGQLVLDTVVKFASSAEDVVGPEHVPPLPGITDALAEGVVASARSLFARMADRADLSCPMFHDVYLKLWQLEGAPMAVRPDWIMVDEAQDTQPVLMKALSLHSVPVTWVGDRHQSIFRFRHAVNAMDAIQARESFLTQSFRFGQDVADLANTVLACKAPASRPARMLRGNPARQTAVGKIPRSERHTFLGRTNVECFKEAVDFRGPVFMVGGLGALDEVERLLKAAHELWRGGKRSARAPGAIARFETWSALCRAAEASRDHELLFARNLVERVYKHQLPDRIDDLRRRHVGSEKDAGLVVSTFHASKGAEYDFVRLGQGCVGPGSPDWLTMTAEEQEDELNLLYVSLTRARFGIEINDAVRDCISHRRAEDPAFKSAGDAGGRFDPPMHGAVGEVSTIGADSRPSSPHVSRNVVNLQAVRGGVTQLQTQAEPEAKADVHRPSSGSWTIQQDDFLARASQAGMSIARMALETRRPSYSVVLRLRVLSPGDEGLDAVSRMVAEALRGRGDHDDVAGQIAYALACPFSRTGQSTA